MHHAHEPALTHAEEPMPSPADHDREARRLIERAGILAKAFDPTGGVPDMLDRALRHLDLAAQPESDLDQEIAQLLAGQRRDEADPP